MATLRGRLPSISLADVLQMLHGNRNTGELRVTRDGQEGIIFLRLGQVVHAQTAAAQGEAAAYEILAWDQGEFEFATTSQQGLSTISRAVPDLLMEAARTTDSRSHLGGIFPDLDLVPWPTVPRAKAAKDLRIAEEYLGAIAFLDGYRTFREIIAASGLTDVGVLQVCAALQGAGRLAVLDPCVAVAVAPAKPGFLAKGYQGKLSMANEAHWQAMLGPYGKQHQPCLLSRAHEAHWKAMGPYAARPIEQVLVLMPGGTKLAPVHFAKDASEHSIEMPRELMEAWQVQEGAPVRIRPSAAPMPRI
jgi:hypothetical protein